MAQFHAVTYISNLENEPNIEVLTVRENFIIFLSLCVTSLRKKVRAKALTCEFMVEIRGIEHLKECLQHVDIFADKRLYLDLNIT